MYLWLLNDKTPVIKMHKQLEHIFVQKFVTQRAGCRNTDQLNTVLTPQQTMAVLNSKQSY